MDHRGFPGAQAGGLSALRGFLSLFSKAFHSLTLSQSLGSASGSQVVSERSQRDTPSPADWGRIRG